MSLRGSLLYLRATAFIFLPVGHDLGTGISINVVVSISRRISWCTVFETVPYAAFPELR